MNDPSNAPPWTPDEYDRAKALWDGGSSAKQVGIAVGRTRNSIIGKQHRHGWCEHRQLTRLTLRPPRNHRAPSSQPKSMDGFNHSDGAIAKGLRRLREGFHLPGAPMLPERPMPPQCAPVTLMDRTSHQCGWILGATAGPLSLMCGAPKALGPPYCTFHADISRGHSSPEWTPERRAKFMKSNGFGGAFASP